MFMFIAVRQVTRLHPTRSTMLKVRDKSCHGLSSMVPSADFENSAAHPGVEHSPTEGRSQWFRSIPAFNTCLSIAVSELRKFSHAFLHGYRALHFRLPRHTDHSDLCADTTTTHLLRMSLRASHSLYSVHDLDLPHASDRRGQIRDYLLSRPTVPFQVVVSVSVFSLHHRVGFVLCTVGVRASVTHVYKEPTGKKDASTRALRCVFCKSRRVCSE